MKSTAAERIYVWVHCSARAEVCTGEQRVQAANRHRTDVATCLAPKELRKAS